jgi:fructose-1,6-bisphosphatase/inositol monophosphatase family enzyme
MSKTYGPLNPHTVGLVMKECVRRAIHEIAGQRMHFTSKEKNGDDLITSADIAAQEIFIKILSENFPQAGIVAEESFAHPCTDPNFKYYFTVDPLDGTKAYGRRQSHAISTMIAFIFEGEVCGATIGDPNTLEVFHSRPGSSRLHRIYEFDTSEELLPKTGNLRKQFLQLRCDPRKLSEFGQEISNPNSPSKLFKDAEVIGGSIGITFTRLWKGEVGALYIAPGTGEQPPWDACPVFGISKKMGYKFFEVIDNEIVPLEFKPSEGFISIKNEFICLHESNVHELKAWTHEHAFQMR